MDDRQKISVVVPMHCEEANVHACYERLKKVFCSLPAFDYELIFVNDGSTDSTLTLLKGLGATDRNVKIVSLSRCFGHQVAISAGLERSSGDAVAVLDGDLQDPPEVLPGMIQKWQEGHHVVYAVRTKRKENPAKRLSYGIFYHVLRKLASVSIPLHSGDFCLMDRRVVRHLNAMPERHRFIRGMRSWVGFRQVGLEYERQARHAGRTKYTLGKLIHLAFEGWFSFSYRPLRLATWLGLVLTSIAFVAGTASIAYSTLTDWQSPGWAPALLLVGFLGGIQLLFIGLLGEYVGRIHDEVQRRPLYVVEEEINL